jgi:hypothetical protein
MDEEKKNLHAVIHLYMYHIECYHKIPPILLFRPIHLLIFSKKSHLYVYSHLYFYQFLYFHGPILLPFKNFLWPLLTSNFLRSQFEATIGNLNQKLINCKRILYWNSKHTLLYPIECYQKIPPILLFRPIRLLIFSKQSHLYIYSHLYFYKFLKTFPTYTFIWNRRLFRTLE